MNDVVPFGVVLCLAALTLLGAVLSNRVSEWVRVPAPGIFLILSAVASDVFHGLGSLSIKVDQRIVTVALIFILFEGGMHIGWGRFRSAAGAVVWLGVVGTFVTAAALALAAQGLFGLGWRASLLIGTALAPTDPAVVFSVLGRREVSGRSGTLLQGESGANDPVGIALMVSILGATGGGWGDVLGGVGEFALQMAVGIAIGAIGGYALLKVMRLPLPNEALYPVRTIAVGVLIYGVAAVCHGSGFLAVFLAGILIGDARAPYKREIERFAAALSSLGEIVAFTTLGLTISLHDVFHGGDLWTGLVLAALMILAVRPVCLGLLLVPIKLDLGERIFVLWSGLKGAVPILLGTFVLSEGVDHASRIYNIIFIAVTVSVIVQGGLRTHCRQAAARADEGRGTRTVGTGPAFPRRARRGPPLSCRPRIARRRLHDRRPRRWRHGVDQHRQPRRPPDSCERADGSAGRRRGAGPRRQRCRIGRCVHPPQAAWGVTR